MKKFIFSALLTIMVVLMLGLPAQASAGQRLPLNLVCGCTIGGGSVVLYDSKVPNSIDMQLVLRGALPNQSWNVIWVKYDPDTYANYSETIIGTITDNAGGAAVFRYTLTVSTPGDYGFRLDLRESGGQNDTLLQYQAGPVTLSFN